MDKGDKDTTENCWKTASELLDNERYVYFKTKDVEVNDATVVHVICYIYPCAKRIQVKRQGRYRGPLIIFTVAQCSIDFEGSVL
jgi:hypothetical protein